MEGMHEFDWKPWVKTELGFLNRDAFVGEMIDVLHFVANMLVAAGCTDDELSNKYAEKQQKNRDRMASGGYSAIKPRCPYCGRNYDEPTTKCTPGAAYVSPDGKSAGQTSAWCAYTIITNGGYTPHDEWVTAQLGTNVSVGDQVRIKDDAYTGQAAKLNGELFEVATIRYGKIEVRHADGQSTAHSPEKLEVRKQGQTS
jgi:hypothetical protein